MSLIIATNINITFGTQKVLDFKQFSIQKGEKIGIVGANGAGKTTLLRVLAGLLPPDQGRVTRSGEVHFLHQFPKSEGNLSGGEKRKEQIVKLKRNKNLIVFADEPTANLDKDGVDWLLHELAQIETLLLISHDRHLLDRLVTRIVEVKEGELLFYEGNYSAYQKAKAGEKNRTEQAYKVHKSKKRGLEQAVANKERQLVKSRQGAKRRKVNNPSEARLGKYRQRLTYKNLERERTVLERRVERLGTAQRVEDTPQFRLDFSKTNPPKNKRVIYSETFTLGYPNSKPLFTKAGLEVLRGERLAVIGGNGTGKTTLLNGLMAGDKQFEIAPLLKIGYLTQDFSQLETTQNVLENVVSTSVQSADVNYSVLAGLLFTGGDLDKKVAVLSGGERMRLSLAKLVLSDCNSLFLDEPTNFLDLPSLEALERTLLAYPGTMVIVSHDKDFVSKVATRTLLLEDGQLKDPRAREKRVKVNTLVLELELDRLVSELAQADQLSAQKKIELEEAYAQVVRQLGKTS